MVAEEIVVSLSGGAPWGFRLQGGAEQQIPLQVAKVRRRSKACRAGLKEHDELVAIGDHMCANLSHAQAMGLLDTQSTTLNLRVKRAPPGFHSPSILPRILSPTSGPVRQDQATIIPTGITSPPDSEAYYGETDSDADIQSLTPRRQRRTPPNVRSPARYDNQTEEETSEMSGYESATDAVVTQRQWDIPCTVGVPRRELIYRPLQPEWTTPTHTPHTLTPHTLSPTLDHSLGEAEGEGDSGFQETGGSGMPICPPLVSPERVKEALMLGSGKQLVPMVGLQQTPVNDELCTTYKDKARQAKLQRGESVVEKQVKEARTKCRSIASLLTDAPNPNSKGVLMFKKRRQRAKKYTLTCFGKAPEDRGTETEGETGGETEEEGGSSILSGSEVDEEGFLGSFDPTWDTGYLDLLERKSSACPSTNPTTPTSNYSPGLDISAYQTPTFGPVDYQSPKLEVISGLDTLAYQDSNLENNITTQLIHSLPNCAPMSPPAMDLTNGGSAAVSRASVVLTPQSQTPMTSQNTQQDNPNVDLNSSFCPNSGVLNRTARPFTPGPSAASRPTVTSVMFRPPQPKPVTTPPKPVAAVSMVTLSPTRQPDSKRAVSSTSLYIPARNTNGNSSDLSSVHSPPSSLSSATLSQPATNPPTFSPPSSVNAARPYHPPLLQPLTSPTAPNYPYAAPVPPVSQPYTPEATHVSMPTPAFPPTPSVNPYFTTQSAMSPTNPPSSPHVPANDSLATREQRISVPAARTGILNDARKRSNKKPMFHAIQSKDVSPNPDLLSMVQNMDDRFEKRPAVETSSGLPSGEVGHESGPEEDWLRLGAEACNFMQAQRQPKPPPVAPKPVTPQIPQLAGKGGELFAKRQNRMDRYVVERSPSVAAAPYSPAQTREPSPTPSLPCAWKYSSNIRAPPPINYNPLLSPSCPLIAQKKTEPPKTATSKGQKAGPKPVDFMNHQPYQLNSSLFSYGGGVQQDSSNSQRQRGTPGNVHKTARVNEVKRFSTPPPTTTGLALKVIVPRSATTLGEPLWRSDIASPPHSAITTPDQPPYQSQWNPSPLSPPPPPAPNAPLPELPTFSSSPGSKPTPNPATANRQFKSVPDLSPVGPAGSSQSNQLCRVPRPRFSTSNLGLQPSIWRPGSTM